MGVSWVEVWRREMGCPNFQTHGFGGQIQHNAQRSFRAIPGDRAYGYGKPFGFLFSISRYRELFSDIGNWNSRYREINFRYREMIDFPISGNDFRISGIDFPISGNVLHMICRYREINSRYPKIATRQKQVTPPPCNTALPHRPLSTMAPSYTGPICLWRPSLRLQ